MISTLFESSQVAEAKRLIDEAHHIVIFTHMAPDGDAMGSSLAMWHWIGERQKSRAVEGSVTVVTPNTFPDFLAWMPGSDRVLIYETTSASSDPVIA